MQKKTKNALPRTGRYVHRPLSPRKDRAYRLTNELCEKFNLDGPLYAVFYGNRRAMVYKYNQRKQIGRVLGFDWNIRPTLYSLMPKEYELPEKLTLRLSVLDQYPESVLTSAMTALGHMTIDVLEA